MIKRNPQIELHPAWMWICDECGATNFERCIVMEHLPSFDDDDESEHVAAVDAVCGDFDEDDIDSIDMAELVDCDDDECECDDDDDELIEAMVCTGSYSIPTCLECKECGCSYDDVVLSNDE